MNWVREYLLSVTAAAVLCGCIGTFFKKTDTVSSLIKTLCGVFVCLTVLRPLLQVSLPDIEDYFSSFSAKTNAVTLEAVQLADNEKCRVIKQQSESYICGKAAAMGCEISASITLSEDDPYAPAEITITGSVSPYAKSSLTALIASDLGIPKEDQHWSS